MVIGMIDWYVKSILKQIPSAKSLMTVGRPARVNKCTQVTARGPLRLPCTNSSQFWSNLALLSTNTSFMSISQKRTWQRHFSHTFVLREAVKKKTDILRSG